MKKYHSSTKIMLFITLLLFSQIAASHCPAHARAEKICFMLDENKVYIWDDKLEHNGPYKDPKNVLKFSDEKGTVLSAKKISRGIYQIESQSILKTIVIEDSQKAFQKITVKAEKH